MTRSRSGEGTPRTTPPTIRTGTLGIIPGRLTRAAGCRTSEYGGLRNTCLGVFGATSRSTRRAYRRLHTQRLDPRLTFPASVLGRRITARARATHSDTKGMATMGLRESRTSRISLPRVGEVTGPIDELWKAVRVAAAAEYTLLGEIGRGRDGIVAYLARDRKDGSLVALKVTPSGDQSEYVLDVATQLDTSVPAPWSECPRCTVLVRGWNRFCTQCGANLWNDRTAGERWDKADLLKAVEEATRGKYEILGEMRRSEGGGIVYFARDLATGKLEALRLQSEGGRDYSIGLTGVLQRFAGSIATYRPPR